VKFPNIGGLLREDLWTSRLDIPAKIALSSLIFSEAPDSANLVRSCDLVEHACMLDDQQYARGGQMP
jgi:hypothetical protein